MSGNKKYYWLKLKEDFFKDKEIKKLRKIAGGDTYTIIYLKLMLLGLRDEGRLLFEGIEDTFAEEIALELDEDVENVKVTLLYLLKMGLLQEVSESEMLLTRLPECVGKETSKAELMRKKRAKDKISGNNVTPQLPPVTKCYTEIEKEIEIDIDIEKEKKIDYQLIADTYNETCVSFPRITVLSDKRKQAIKARLKTYTVEQFKEMFKKAEESSFLKGSNSRDWRASFDWLIKDSNFAKVLDGNYDDKKATTKTYKRENDVDLTGIL